MRGRGVTGHEETRAAVVEFAGAEGYPALDRLAACDNALDGLADIARSMTRASRSLDARFVPASGRVDVSATRAVLEAVQDLRALGPVDRDAAMEATARLTVRVGAASEPGRVAVLDLRRARTRRFQAVFVLGLEEGSLPGASSERQVLDADSAEALGVSRPDAVEVERHLFTIACTRPWARLALARQAATEEGKPLEPSPFWAEVVRVLGDHAPRLVRRRGLADVSYPLDEAPSDRERLRALARSLRDDADWATAVAAATGWERKLSRAATAARRDPDVRDAELREGLAATERFSVTELEKYVDCSSMWFVERVLDPRQIDFELDARTRGSIAHATLARFYAALPAEVGVERLSHDDLPAAYALMRRCLGDALAGQKVPDSAAGKELARALERDLDAFLREEAELALPLVPRRYEVRFGSPMAAPGIEGGPGDRRLPRLGPDRPDRRRPGDVAARPGVGLQVGRGGAFGGRDGPRGPPPDPALHPRAARPARDGADRRDVPRARGQARRARARPRRRGRLRRPRGRGRRRRRNVLGADRPRPGAGRDGASPGCGRAACATTPAGATARPGAPSTPSAGWRAHDRPVQRRAARGRRPARAGVRVSGCGHRQDRGARRARAAPVPRRHAHRPPARDHVHRPGGGGAQAPGARGARAGRRDGAGPGRRHRVDLDDPSLLPSHPPRPRLRGRPRSSLCDRRRRALGDAPARGVRPRARAVPGGGPRPPARSPRHLRPAPPAPDDPRRPRAPSQRRAPARPAAGRALRPGRGARRSEVGRR